MNSRDYWAQREEEQLRHNLTDEREYSRQIEKIYQDMLDKCQREIDAFYGRYASAEGITIAEAKKRVSKMDIAAYERKAARYVKEKNFSKQANVEMRLYNAAMKINRLELLKANIGLELLAGHAELESFMAEILQGRTMDELRRQAGILGERVKNNAQLSRAIVNSSFHNATFSDRIWMYQDILRNELSSLLQSGLIQGKGSAELAKELRKRFNVKVSDAERLMITELRRVQTEAAKQSYERNGNEEYIFLALNPEVNSVICDECKKLDGQHFKVADMKPGENAPPMHPRCHCSTAPYVDRKEYEAWLDYLSKGGTTAEWNRLKENSAVANTGRSGIIKIERAMANGLRRSVYHVLSNEEIEAIRADIKAIGADETAFRFNYGSRTAYSDEIDIISVRGDVLPDNTSTHPRDLMSSRAVLAHEYYGHRAYRGTNLKSGSWNDEFRASYMAAKNAPNLTDEDRYYLILDALERAKEAGVTINYNDFIRRVLYGF